MSCKKINCGIIKDVFETMKYDEKNEENRSGMEEYLKQLTIEETKSFLSSISKNDKWSELGNGERAELMNKLGSEISKATDLFAELEKRIKNIKTNFMKDKAIPYLVETLGYYANLCQLVKVAQKGLVVCKLSDVSCFSLLGYTLGPALAAGFKVLFVSSPKMGSFIELIISLALKVGFPKETISIIPGSTNLAIVYEHASVIHLFDTPDEKLQNDKMLGVIPLSIPFIIFDSADLDSACDAIVNSTWKDQLLFNSLAKEVFVQETIVKDFIKRLKEKVNANTCKLNTNKCAETVKNLITEADKNGVEVYTSHYGHVLFFGGRIIDKESSIAPCVSITAFRNTDESIALANNNVQGLSASVWTENIGVANYVARKLDVSNVWINSFGIYSPEIVFTPQKLSGKGFFGGIQGFHELLLYNKDLVNFTGTKILLDKKDILKSITTAKNAHQKWKSLSKTNRINLFNALIKFIENNRNEFKNVEVSEEWLREWKTLFNQYIESYQNLCTQSPYKEYDLNVSYCPKGVLVAEFTKHVANHNKRLLIASIVEGNSLILLNQYEQLQVFYEKLSKILPTGVLTVLPFGYGANSEIIKNPMVNCYFNEYKVGENVSICDKFMSVSNCWSDVKYKVTFVKNVWSNIGQGYNL